MTGYKGEFQMKRSITRGVTAKCATVVAAAIGAMGLAAVGWAGPANADYTVCNKTTRDVRVAVGYVSPIEGFVSKGWYDLRAGGDCRLMVADGATSDPHNYFFFAKDIGGDGRWEGDVALCTTRKAFLIEGFQTARNWCADHGYDRRFFRHVESPSGNMTTNLTDGHSQIIDEG
jgi:uncharacterized membrane protein